MLTVMSISIEDLDGISKHVGSVQKCHTPKSSGLESPLANCLMITLGQFLQRFQVLGCSKQGHGDVIWAPDPVGPVTEWKMMEDGCRNVTRKVGKMTINDEMGDPF